jgi:rod shape determining protein RodA
MPTDMLNVLIKYTRLINFFIFAITLTIAAIGTLFIYSATHTYTQPYSPYFIKQVIGICCGAIMYLIFCFIDFRTLCRWGYFLYFFLIILLIFTLIKGSIGMGAQRWIDIKLFRFQPSELAKIFLPAFIVFFLHEEKDAYKKSFTTFAPLIIIVLISFLLILKQPDLGTALIVLGSSTILFWYAGLQKRFFTITALALLITAPIFYKCLKPYQRKRIEVFFGAGDQYHERYHVEQSKIAIGSGGLHGKGFLQGTQNRLAFLPERRTDFIFSVLCEEWGFVGATALLLLYLLLITYILSALRSIKSSFSKLLVIGLIIPIMLSIVINLGMVTGILPVVGIPLPLMSCGLTHLFVTFAALGWINGTMSRTSRLHASW